MKVTNENALRASIDKREYRSDADYEADIRARLKTVEAPNERTGLDLLAADECPDEDPNLQDPEA